MAEMDPAMEGGNGGGGAPAAEVDSNSEESSVDPGDVRRGEF
jgi:hypothetical protein